MSRLSLSDVISKAATKRTVTVASVLSILYLIPYVLLVFKEELSKGPLLDQHFIVTASQLHSTLASYGAHLRAHYVRGELIDLGVAGLLFTIALIASYASKRKSKKSLLNLIPVGAALLNTVKVIIFIPIILNYQHVPTWLVWSANIVNAPKNILMIASIGVLVMASGSLLRRPSLPRTA